MNIKTSVNTVTETHFDIYLANTVRGTNPLTVHTNPIVNTYLDLASTTNNSYGTIFINKYSVEDIGIIEVISVEVDVGILVKGNGSIRWQISGDDGNTWVSFIERAFNVGVFASLIRVGRGMWITSINTGINQLQIRLQSLANAGTVNVKIGDPSEMLVVYRQKIET